MPSAISLSSSIIPDFKDFRSKTPSFSLPKSPKAAKRFFGFPSGNDSPPVPPLPANAHQHAPSSTTVGSITSSSTPVGGFSGATVVRTPQEALEGIKSLTPPILPQLPIAHAYLNERRGPNHLQSNSLDRGKNIVGNTYPATGQTIHRSQSATDRLRSPISVNSTSNPPTPSTAPCRSGIVEIKGVLKSPSYGYLKGEETANEWAREVLGSIRISTDHKDPAFMGLGEGEELNSFIESYGTRCDTFKPIPSSLASTFTSSATSIQTFGRSDNQENVQVHHQSGIASLENQQGYTEDQYKPYVQSNAPPSTPSVGSIMMLDEASYPPRSTSTLQHLEEVKFTPIPTTSTYSVLSSSRMTATPEDDYDDTDYDPFKKISHYPSSSISTLPNSTTTLNPESTMQEASSPEKPIKYTTPTYPQANPSQSTYSPLGSKTKRLPDVEEEDNSFMIALPTQDFTRSPSTHSMNPPSPIETAPDPPSSSNLSGKPKIDERTPLYGHMRSPSTPSPFSALPRTIQTHHRSPSSPAEFTPSPLSPGPNVPIQRFNRRPSMLSDRGMTKSPHPATRVNTKPSSLQRISVQTPFHATILEDKIQSLPDNDSPNLILLNLEFAYSLDEKPNNAKVIIPLQVLQNQGSNNLVDWIDRYLNRNSTNSKKVFSTVTTIPEMTDGESAEESDLESDNGLTALLRDEYLNSILMPNSPSTVTGQATSQHIDNTLSIKPSTESETDRTESIHLPSTPATMLNALNEMPIRVQSPNNQMWKRGVTPKQYEQLQAIYPTPLSSLGSTSDHDDDGRPMTEGADGIHNIEEKDNKFDEKNWIPPKTPPLSIRRHSKSHLPPSNISVPLNLEYNDDGKKEKEDKGKLRELRIFLTREAGSWHKIAHKLLSGKWGYMNEEVKIRILNELEWCGMVNLMNELESKGPQSISIARSNVRYKPSTSMSAGFIGFTPLNENSDITVNDYPLNGIAQKQITRSSSSTSLMMLREKGSRISGVYRGGSGYI
ncbi:uncharacterized protein I206_106987 [Kwoniella pini CBS 10737]|uniref:Uncharacterized protein n=1 Tax=Kwoniella pini CBS 10737 TaxID=1296096 RepID=A0A1B9HZK2_9TREE|nr:uncharacterized protein I206_05470 [Kwoniella pini CBS 10737]OCF48690.1 hypothetical protein I206_05470 [Kwoniella pini CBS 10737]